MNDLEPELSARLHTLADELAGPAPALSAPDAVARYRHRRRTRAGLVAVAAAVVAIAVGVPTAFGSLSSAPARPAAPVTSTTTTPAPADRSSDDAERLAAESAARAAADQAARAAQTLVEARAAQQAAQPELDALVAALGGPVVLSSPAEWDQWLPEGKSMQGTTGEEDMRTCPRIASRLTAALGMRMSYWKGTLPAGPVGCTWVDVPLDYNGPYDYEYSISIGFLGLGATVDQVAQNSFDGTPDHLVPCPRVPVAGPGRGGVLIRCDGMDDRYGAAFTLAVPDERGAGIWLLMASAQHEAPQDSAVALTTLVEAASGAYG